MTTSIPWDIDNLTIKHGNHPPPNGKVESCAMEACYLRWAARQGWDKQAVISGWTDSLACVDPLIGGFVRRWNDALGSDEARTRIFTPELLDLLPDTRGDDELMRRRMWMSIDWDIRTRTPAFLRLAKLDVCAAELEALAPIRSQEDLANAGPACAEARTQAAAPRDAAGDAARDAAGDAARSRLRPTVEAMHASAVDLLRRMCAAR